MGVVAALVVVVIVGFWTAVASAARDVTDGVASGFGLSAFGGLMAAPAFSRAGGASARRRWAYACSFR